MRGHGVNKMQDHMFAGGTIQKMQIGINKTFNYCNSNKELILFMEFLMNDYRIVSATYGTHKDEKDGKIIGLENQNSPVRVFPPKK